MKINYLYLLVVLASIIGCKQYPKKKEINKRTTKIDSLRSNLIGKWGGKSGKPIFEILEDSIHYFKIDSSYLYELKGDTFAVKFSEHDTLSNWGKIKVIVDTLEIIDYRMNNFVTKGYRFKH